MHGFVQQILQHVVLPQQDGSKGASLRVLLDSPAFLLYLKLLLHWHFKIHPFSKFHGAAPFSHSVDMKCPKCNSGNMRALHTNNRPQDHAVRRRQCRDCGHQWFTAELIAPDYACSWENRGGLGSKPCLKLPVDVISWQADG